MRIRSKHFSWQDPAPVYQAVGPLVFIGLYLFIVRMRWPASKAFLQRLKG